MGKGLKAVDTLRHCGLISGNATCFTTEALNLLLNDIEEDLNVKVRQDLLLNNIKRNGIKDPHNMTPLSLIFNGMPKEERYRFTEHIYYTFTEMQEAYCEEVKKNEEMQETCDAFDIVNKKNVDIWWIRECKNLESYNNSCKEEEHLTQKEFNLLRKKVRNNGEC